MRIQFIVAALMAGAAFPAAATTIVAGSDWQYDQTNAADVASMNSTWDFTVAGNAIFRVTDGFATGDIYKLFDDDLLLATSSFFEGEVLASTNLYGLQTAFESIRFSKLNWLVGPGSYSFTITGNCGGGCPAGLGVRLDAIDGVDVPEPAALALFASGFGLAAFARRRRKVTHAA